MGKVYKYGDNIDTDVIVPGKYLSLAKPSDLARVCMIGLDPSFAETVKNGDIILAGENFGCGSSREHAPISIKASGVSCVIAKSFARIFFRNALNIGLVVLESTEAVDEISSGDDVEVFLDQGIIRNNTTGKEYKFIPYPPFIMELINVGGIKNYIAERKEEA